MIDYFCQMGEFVTSSNKSPKEYDKSAELSSQNDKSARCISYIHSGAGLTAALLKKIKWERAGVCAANFYMHVRG